jgi:hypothetical protein
MRLMECTLFLSLVTLAACQSSTEFKGSRLSDTTMSFLVNGQKIVISDSLFAGDPDLQAIWAEYDYFDSILQINGSTAGAKISFHLRMLPDTGEKLLTNNPFNSHSLSGSAYVSFLHYGWIDSRYITDSVHTGVLRITEFDTINDRISGTFQFYAIRRSDADTIYVGYGVIDHIHIIRPK